LTDEWTRVCTHLQRLEELASERGEAGLAISLSKPFHRLLKYPRLFQKLLYHTDPSMVEYESTLQMVAEVETIVHSIEDEKIQKEKYEQTQDVLARIEGLDKIVLPVPKPSRILVDERLMLGSVASLSPSPSAEQGKGINGKTSFKRLSDVLPGSNGIGGKRDLWLVVFNDVVLRCQRIGQTSLPIVATATPYTRTTNLADFQGKSKYASTGRNHSYAKPRNLYRLIKVCSSSLLHIMRQLMHILRLKLGILQISLSLVKAWFQWKSTFLAG
jgi:hypothetical protein